MPKRSGKSAVENASVRPLGPMARTTLSYWDRSGTSTTLTHRIVEDLGIAVVTGRYASDKTFPVEADFCAQYGVSRAICREAIKMLKAKGLLDARPRKGTWVQPEENWNLMDSDVLRWLLERKLSLGLLIEFTQMRLAVEPIAAALAATAAKPSDRWAIQSAIARMAAAEKGDDDPLASDIAFHVSVMRACGNRFYGQLCELISTALQFSIRTTNHFKGVKRASVEDHRRVADAIIAGDGVMAETTMRELIQEALDLVCEAEANEQLRGTNVRKSNSM